MISILLDTSYHNLVISIFEGKKCLYHVEEECDRELSIKLLPSIENAFNSISRDIKDVEKIFIVNGPGSFTGVRIGVTFAKTLAWALGKTVIPISELELLATTKMDKKYIAPMIDARRDYVYAGLYDENLNPIIQDQHILLKDFLNMVSSRVNLNDVQIISFDQFDEITVEPAKVDSFKILEKHFSDEGVDAHVLIPNYLKRTEAEEKREHDLSHS